jgi:hypothetical protein
MQVDLESIDSVLRVVLACHYDSVLQRLIELYCEYVPDHYCCMAVFVAESIAYFTQDISLLRQQSLRHGPSLACMSDFSDGKALPSSFWEKLFGIFFTNVKHAPHDNRNENNIECYPTEHMRPADVGSYDLIFMCSAECDGRRFSFQVLRSKSDPCVRRCKYAITIVTDSLPWFVLTRIAQQTPDSILIK